MTVNNNTIEDKKFRLVVYTALFGDYDDLIDPPLRFEGCDFICFTDQNHFKSDFWEIRLVDDGDLPANMMNRKYKMLPHLFFPEYERSLYIDSNITVLKNPKELSDKYLEIYDFVIPKHFARDCLYEEAFILVRSGRVEIKQLYLQSYEYLKDGFSCQTLMGENNILCRVHNNVVDLSEKWWELYRTGVSRDQLSLSYLAWKNGISIGIEQELSSRGEGYFSIQQHKQKVQTNIVVKILRMMFFGYPYIIFVKLFLFFNMRIKRDRKNSLS